MAPFRSHRHHTGVSRYTVLRGGLPALILQQNNQKRCHESTTNERCADVHLRASFESFHDAKGDSQEYRNESSDDHQRGD